MRRDLLAALAAVLLVMCSGKQTRPEPRDNGTGASSSRKQGLPRPPMDRLGPAPPSYLIPASAVPSLDLNQAAENLGKLIAIGRENDARFWLTAFKDQSPCQMTASWEPSLHRFTESVNKRYVGSASVRLRYRRTPYLVESGGVFSFARWVFVRVSVSCP